MKRFLLLTAALFISVLVCADSKKIVPRTNGRWAPIELSKSEICFGRRGGKITVEAKNYSTWKINNIQISGTDTIFYADAGADYSYKTASGDGISAEVKGNTVVIKVEASRFKQDWTISMQAGNAFTHIHVRKRGR